MQNGFTVFLDMDGVLADFHKGACEAHGMPVDWPETYDFWREWGMSDEDFWEPMQFDWFWADLPWTPDGQRILQAACAVVGERNVHIASAPPRRQTPAGAPLATPAAHSGKAFWLDEHIPQLNERLHLGHDKAVFAGSRSILVDDLDANIDAFREAGGVGILVPRPWNTLKGAEAIVHVQEELWRATS